MKNLFLKVILPLVGIAGILGFITVLNPIQQQEADWSRGYQYYGNCGVTVYLQPVGGNTCTSSYNSGMEVWASSNNSNYIIHTGWQTYWCPTLTSGPCLSNGTSPSTRSFAASTSHQTVSAPTAHSLGSFSGMACGQYQDDFGFYVTNKQTGKIVCNANIKNSIDNHNLGGNNLNNNNASYCSTGKTCSTPVCNNTTTPACEGTHSHTVTKDCHGNIVSGGDHDNGPSASCNATCEELHNCGVTPTVTPTAEPSPTLSPSPEVTVTPTQPVNNNASCGDNSTQVGTNNNANCNNNTNQQQQGQSQGQVQGQTQEQNNHQTIENNANNSNTVNITLNGGGQQQQQQQQQVLGTSTTPTQLPSTGAGADVVFGLISLIPLGWKLRKLA